MRKFLQRLFREPVRRLANKYDSRPDKRRVHTALTSLYLHLLKYPGKKGPVISFDMESRFIILSDQHKGAKDGRDDFALAEKNYLNALEYYNQNQFFYINLGDSEELWKNSLASVIKHNQLSFDKEKLFLQRDAFIKVFGNHDLYWANDPLAGLTLESIYGMKVPIYTGTVLQTLINGKPLNIFMTHGHQGDRQSDGNWFSKWFVSVIWARLQSYLNLNPNTPANDDSLKNKHNTMMYEWSARQKSLLLITGHTHQPVFVSLTYLERLYRDLDKARLAGDTDILIKEIDKQINLRIRKGDPVPDFTAYHSYYFNSGCCCFDDGDITGIEIADGFIRLIKWKYDADGFSKRMVLEETSLESLLAIGI